MSTDSFIARLAKADFADAVGIAIGRNSVSAALVRKRFNAVTLVAAASTELSGPAEARDADITGFLREFVDSHDAQGARTSIALDRRDAFIARLQLPATAAENIDNVVTYELDRLTPLPSESVYSDHFTTPVGTEGERIAATVVVAPREHVEGARDLVASAGLAPTVVTAQPVALCDYANFCTGGQPQVCGVFARDDDQETMTVCCDGSLVSSHRYDGRGPDSPLTALRREVERALPDRTADEPRIIRDDDDMTSIGMARLAPEEFLESVSNPNAQQLTAIGAALGRLNEGRNKLNLLPAELVQPEEAVGMRELGLAAAVIALALFLVGAVALKNMQVSSALASELGRLDPLVTEVSRQEAETRALAEKVKLLEGSRGASTVEYLRELTALVPKTAYLTTFRYRNERLEVDGIADKASELISILEKSRYFKDVEFTAPTTKYLQTKERFSLRMGLEE